MYFRCSKNKKIDLTKQSYISILNAQSVEIKEKGSKFIGLAACCRDEEEVKLQLEIWHLEHPQATHICYAYRLGIEGDKWRANDDGEPNNSAGAPILGQIQSADLTNVLVGVVRYYGGTKLGVGGLVQTYKEAAKKVLEEAEKKEYILYDYYQLSMNYTDMPHVMSILKRNRVEIEHSEMQELCKVVFRWNPMESFKIKEMLAMYDSVEIEYIERK